MKVLILNHCSHNKGDNSVLFYLTECLKLVSKDNSVTVSCSDGQIPFWADNDVSSVYWPGGKIFKSPQVSFTSNAMRRLNFLLMRKVVYKLFLRLYSSGHILTSKIFANLFLGRDLIKSIQVSDKVICTGGHHISNVLENDCVNPQLVSLALSELYDKKIIMWSQSIGPIDTASGYSKRTMGKVFDSCSRIFVRDNLSEQCVQSTSNSKTIKAPDSVFLSNVLVNSDSVTNHKPYVCCAVYTAGISDQEYLKRYRNSWITICRGLISKEYDVVFVPMQYKGFGGDERPFLAEIVKALDSDKVRFVDEDSSPKETLNLFKHSSFIIGHKTHSVIYGLALEIPTIAIAYHEKTRYFMSLFGFNDYVFDDVLGVENGIIDLISDDTYKAQKAVHEKQMNSNLFAKQLIKNLDDALHG